MQQQRSGILVHYSSTTQTHGEEIVSLRVRITHWFLGIGDKIWSRLPYKLVDRLIEMLVIIPGFPSAILEAQLQVPEHPCHG